MSDMQKDLVLSINEYAYVLDKTKGNVSCWVGPTKTSLSTSDELVIFNPKTKSFESSSYGAAVTLFTTAPENWYVILKNPTANGKHPATGTANSLPEGIEIGRKVNIRGPVSFALYPGQMAKAVRGHALRSNQYLLARVYEAEAANSSKGDIRDAEGNVIESTDTYVNGQILVIKGTEVSFYIPPTGIEVIPVDNDHSKGYVRNAVTLERLEYCILKDEDGNKRYVHGPEVVFPKPTETFVTSPKGGTIFRALELSPISGIYIKVIAAYEENGIKHPVGEELFITGNDQMIYYPRPEHAVISYDGKTLHHAIAIPEGEGRYVLNRLTGEITTIKGPAMYLPDPRTEVIVKRKLSPTQCRLWYPGNNEALAYNNSLTEKSVEKSMTKASNYAAFDSLDAMAYSTTTASASLAAFESNASISRGTSYTKPRTVTLDTKYEGAVAMDVWTGYAVRLISKNGEKKVVCGPQTILLDYDQTLEILNPSHTANKPEQAVFLRYTNNKIADRFTIETKDHVQAILNVNYNIDFDETYMDKWFDIDDYCQYVREIYHTFIRKDVGTYTIEEFYNAYEDIAKNALNDRDPLPANGIKINSVEVTLLEIAPDVAELIEEHNLDLVRKSLELSEANKRVKLAKALSEAEEEEQKLRYQETLNKMELQRTEAVKKLEIQHEVNRLTELENQAKKQAEVDMQNLVNIIHTAGLDRKEQENKLTLDFENKKAEIEKAKSEAYAATIASIMASITPDLVAALTSKSNAETLKAVTGAMSPVAIAKGESVADTVNLLLRGTPLEGVIEQIANK